MIIFSQKLGWAGLVWEAQIVSLARAPLWKCLVWTLLEQSTRVSMCVPRIFPVELDPYTVILKGLARNQRLLYESLQRILACHLPHKKDTKPIQI